MIYWDIIQKQHKDCKEIETNSLIALCEIKNYDIFCKELESLITSKKKENLIYKIYHIMQGKYVLGNKKYKDFVKKYQDIIEIMKKHHCLSNMTILKYNLDGTLNNRATDDFFYKFISEHKDNIETIKEIAIKIKNLGFDKIIYGENLDFTDMEYELRFVYEHYFEYLENIEIIPAYNNNSIRYKTTDSCYCMTICASHYGSDKHTIIEYGRKIALNSLIFDPNRLPNEISIESTIGNIKKLFKDSKKDYQIIRDTVDMSIYTEDLINQYNRTKYIIESIESLKNKEQVKQILLNISKEINELKLVSLAFENEIIDSSEKIDEDKIKNEKQLCLMRRRYENFDLD